MENVKIDIKNSILTIVVDLNKNGVPSASGKTLVIATSRGNALIDPEKKIYMGLNVYKAR